MAYRPLLAFGSSFLIMWVPGRLVRRSLGLEGLLTAQDVTHIKEKEAEGGESVVTPGLISFLPWDAFWMTVRSRLCLPEGTQRKDMAAMRPRPGRQ